MLIIDILMSVSTSYIKNGYLIKKRSKIAKRYLKKYFIFDFISIFPFILIKANLIKEPYFKLFFYFKLVIAKKHLYALKNYFFTSEMTQNILSIITVLFFSLYISHIFACFWHFCGIYFKDQENWLKKRNLIHKGWLKKYYYSYYWSITTIMTVGYGDITPQNEYEIIFSIFVMIIGCAIYSYNISSMGIIITRLDKNNKKTK